MAVGSGLGAATEPNQVAATNKDRAMAIGSVAVSSDGMAA